ncbi:HAD-like domain-containing protein [Obelidium mucronatum]|nr:HAD-like domain-containing protein [Obelidium mucronatum]
MDGVLYHGNQLLPGVKDFVEWLKREKKQFLFLTNSASPTPQELSDRLASMGLPGIPPSNFYTSALATAKFLQSQKPEGGKCFVLGTSGLTYTLYEHGFSMSDVDPDYVVIGSEGPSHSFEAMQKALSLITKGNAKLIGTNHDTDSIGEGGVRVLGPGCFLAALEVASGKKAFTCGKPSSLMMGYAQGYLGLPKEDICIIGDRMDTDILAGTSAQIDPVLVMSGVTNTDNLYRDAYRPYLVLNGVSELAFSVPPW